MPGKSGPHDSTHSWRLPNGDIAIELSRDDAQMLREYHEWLNSEYMRVWGRPAGPEDPLFPDWDAPVPQPVRSDEFHRIATQALRSAGMPEEFIYAYEFSGILVTEDNEHLHDEADLAAWDKAIQEYRALRRR